MASTFQFLLHGHKYFTRNGWIRASTKGDIYYPKDDDLLKNDSQWKPLLNNKIFVVTGASSGIGKELTRILYGHSATVLMVVRSKEKGEAIKEEIATSFEENGNKFDKSKLVLVIGDMSLEKDVRSVWNEVRNNYDHVDGVICNAGSLLSKKTLTSEGHEVTWASHLLFGYYLFGSLGIPLLEKSESESPRLLFVTSGGSILTRLPGDWDQAANITGKYDGVNAYSIAKRAEIIVAEEMAKDLKNSGSKVQVCSAHPGWTDTPGVDQAFGFFKFLFQPLRNPFEGAEGIAWLVGFAAKSQVESGSLYLDRSPQAKHLSSKSQNTESEISEFMTRLKKDVQVQQ